MSDRVYIIVPRTVDSDKPPYKFTMSCGRMAAHVAHVSGILAQRTGIDAAQLDIIVLACANSAEFRAVREELNRREIAYVEYLDEDNAFEGELLTAIATYPLSKDRATALKKLRPWRCACNDGETARPMKVN